MKRQAATNRGLARRVDDLRLEQVADVREQQCVDHPLPVVLTAVISAMASDAPGLRGAETRTDQIAANHEDGWKGIAQRIADNTIGAVLRRLEPQDLVKCLHHMVKAEHRRGNLDPVVLPVGTASIDGKNTATLRWHDLRRLAGVDKQQASVEDIKEFFRKHFPQVQVCVPRDGDPYGLIRSHTVTLVSSLAAYGLHIRNIPGATSEIGALPETLRELHNAYGRTGIIQMLTTDAGNTSLPTNTLIVKAYKPTFRRSDVAFLPPLAILSVFEFSTAAGKNPVAWQRKVAKLRSIVSLISEVDDRPTSLRARPSIPVADCRR